MISKRMLAMLFLFKREQNNSAPLFIITFITAITHHSSFITHGTGSYPCPPQGWQRRILFTVSHPPLNKPYFLSACTPYWEQLGVNLHLGPRTGETTSW
jgi:hypothetical protein